MKIIAEYIGGTGDEHTRREPIVTKGLLWLRFESSDGVITVKPDDSATGLEVNSPTGRLRVNPSSANLILIESVRFGDD